MGVPVGSDLEYTDEITMRRRSKGAARSSVARRGSLSLVERLSPGLRSLDTGPVMLPHAYELARLRFSWCLSAALTCFAGYKLFRIVLTIWGFILGAMLGSSIVGRQHGAGMVMAGLVGGLLGALVACLCIFRRRPPSWAPDSACSSRT